MVRRNKELVDDREIADAFHRLWYEKGLLAGLRWLGVNIQKCPTDLLIYQEIIQETQPTLVVETGTGEGGSALFFASILKLVHPAPTVAEIISIDIKPPPSIPASDSHIRWLTGSSVDPIVVAHVHGLAASHGRVMVVLDSAHDRPHVLAELDAYAQLVSCGCYLIVEDTNPQHPVEMLRGIPGPLAALQQWLPAHPEFIADVSCEKFILTFNPGGFLKRS